MQGKRPPEDERRKGSAMRKLIALIGIALGLWVAPAAFAVPANVLVTATGFNPPSVTIEAGETVTWRNTDTEAHRVVVSGAQCNLSLQSLQSSSCEFNTPGTFTYRDPDEAGTGFRGTIEVESAPTRAVTIEAPRRIVLFGDALRLSGSISSRQANQTVTITVDPAGEPARRIELETTEGGAWTLRAQPRIRTQYTARWRNSTSEVLTVQVRPRVTLRKVGRNLFAVVVVAAESFAGNHVEIRRQRSRTNRALVRVRRVVLNENPRTETIAQRTFRLRVRRGFGMRAFLPLSQAAPNYVASQSNLIRA
jgi:plastocyanin